MTQRFRSFAGQPVLRFIRDANAAARPLWRRPWEPEVRFVQPGLTIGADSDCSVCIDGPGIKDIHVRVTRDERGRVWAHAETARPFETLDDQSIWALELKPGEKFRVGHVLFECDEVKVEQKTDEQPEDELHKPSAAGEKNPASAPLELGELSRAAASQADVATAEPLVASPSVAAAPETPPTESQPPAAIHAPLLSTVEALCCAQCRSPVAHLPTVARFCPRCGAMLPIDRPPPPAAPPLMPDEHAAQFLGWLMPLIHADSQRPGGGAISTHTARPATLIAYINTLLHLGVRYEAGIGGTRNLAQALRYYRKAAKLGNELAQARVAVDAARPPEAGSSSS
jgi:hypothetical protein